MAAASGLLLALGSVKDFRSECCLSLVVQEEIGERWAAASGVLLALSSVWNRLDQVLPVLDDSGGNRGN
eukprot:935968-Pelagomonas_calceolata.AAC.2